MLRVMTESLDRNPPLEKLDTYETCVSVFSSDRPAEQLDRSSPIVVIEVEVVVFFCFGVQSTIDSCEIPVLGCILVRGFNLTPTTYS